MSILNPKYNLAIDDFDNKDLIHLYAANIPYAKCLHQHTSVACYQQLRDIACFLRGLREMSTFQIKNGDPFLITTE